MNINKYIFENLIFNPVVSVKAKGFKYILYKMLESQYMPVVTTDRVRLSKLQWLIKNAKQNVPHYKLMLKGIEVEEINTLDCIKYLPTITKQDIKVNSINFTSEKKLGLLTKKTTGGSTGQPVTIWKTRVALAAELAAMWRGYSWAGITIGDKQARFWGVPFDFKDKILSKTIDFVCNRKRFSAFAFTETDLETYAKSIISNKFDYIYGYVSMVSEFADFFARKYNANDINLKAIIVTSEVLHEIQRGTINKALNTKVYNEYGCGEIGTIAHECEMGSLHLSIENMIIEIMNGDKICQAGEIGEIVVTELNNYAMPLIRYRLGDFGSLSSKKCKCGRTLPVINNIHGRAYDTVITEDGRKFHGEFFMYIIEETKKQGHGIAKFQVIQKDIRSFLIKIVPETSYSKAAEQLIISRVKQYIGENTQVDIEIVNDIQREKSGKMRLIVGMNSSL